MTSLSSRKVLLNIRVKSNICGRLLIVRRLQRPGLIIFQPLTRVNKHSNDSGFTICPEETRLCIHLILVDTQVRVFLDPACKSMLV